MSQSVAFIGLGVMGFPMAGHLQQQGHQVTVYNRTTEKAKRWVERYGGQQASTPAAAARKADWVFICVGRDQDVASVCQGSEGIFSALQPGAIVVDHSTISATMSQTLAQQAKTQGNDFLDAPVSGGQAGAENGQLTIMVGGQRESYQRTEPLMQAYAKKLKHFGPSGHGQLCKMVNQICIAGLVQGLSEGLHFAMQAGLDPVEVVESIGQGAAGSWQMLNRVNTMRDNQFDHGFAIDWMRKDLAIALEEAAKNGAELPVTRLVDGFYQELQAQGGGRWDTSALIKRLHSYPSD